MRIWSLHPKHLDSKGLVALWRETLLAKNVLEGKTKGYKNHPQLNRFKKNKNPLNSINKYLSLVYAESVERGYNFNKEKINWNFDEQDLLSVTSGQMEYERNHLLKKLKVRDHKRYLELTKIENLDSHPLFAVVKGEIEDWEII